MSYLAICVQESAGIAIEVIFVSQHSPDDAISCAAEASAGLYQSSGLEESTGRRHTTNCVWTGSRCAVFP